VVTDEGAERYKPRPLIPYEQRIEIIRNISGVGEVEPFVSRYGSEIGWGYRKAIRYWRPDFVIHGDDWNRGVLKGEKEAIEEELAKYGGKLIEVPYTEGISSTMLKEKLWMQKSSSKRKA
jgi:phosphoenolpyruvate phosphomutase / 2-hydroxyethylphosphonate cytidylyltransferase